MRQVKTKGLVLSNIKYKESSIITRIYTEKLGLRSYIVNSVRAKKSKMALFQPLTLLDLVVYEKNTEGLNRLTEYKCMSHNPSIASNMQKMSIAIFLSEVLNKVLREEEENEGLFGFLETSIDFLESVEANYVNFHLIFLIQLTRYLGFIPGSSQELLGQITSPDGLGIVSKLSPKEQEKLNQLISGTYNEAIQLAYLERKHILDHLLLYYQIHIGGLGEIKSIEVLKEVMQ